MATEKRSKFDIRHKEALRLCLREYFELFFPDLAKIMRFDTAKFLDKELIALFGEPKGRRKEKDQQRLTDALISIQIDLNGTLEWILIHWEQESKRKGGFEERMFHYFCGIYFKHRKLIFPIAMFTDPAKWRKPITKTFNISLLQYPVNEFTYRLIKLKDYKAKEFEDLAGKNPLAAAYLPLTDYPKRDRPVIKAKAVRGIAKMPTGPKRATLFSLIQESIPLNKSEERKYQKLIQTDPFYEEVKMLQSIEEVGMERGLELGLEQGLEQGQILTLRKIAKNLLQSRKLTQKEIVAVTGLKPGEISKLARTLTS